MGCLFLVLPYLIVVNYIVVFILAVMNVFFIDRMRYNRLVLFIPFFFTIYLLTIFSAGRNVGFGPDDLNYQTYLWLSNNDYPIPASVDIAFKWLLSLISYFSASLNVLFGTIVVISFSLVYYGVFKKSKYIVLSLLILISHTFWFREINQIRAAISYSIIFLFFVFYYDFGVVKRCLLFLLGCAFHFTAVFSLIPIILCQIEYKKRMFSLFLVLAIFLMPFLIEFILSFFALLPGGGLLVAKIQKYMLDSGGYATSLSMFNPTSIKYLIYYSVINIFFSEKEINSDKCTKLLFVCVFLSVFWVYSFREYSVLAGRVSSLFFVIELIIVPMLVFKLKGSITNRIAIPFVFLLYAILFVYNVINRELFFNYQFEWLF